MNYKNLVEPIEPNLYELEINFQFDLQFNYNNYHSSFIDGLIKVATIMVYFLVFWAVLCQLVRIQFNHELFDTIVKLDQEIHISQGKVVLSLEESRDRFASKLSY